jgi:hypothetical protein
VSAGDRPRVTVDSETLCAFFWEYHSQRTYLTVEESMIEAITAAFPGRDPREVALEALVNTYAQMVTRIARALDLAAAHEHVGGGQ